jgi:hypothetical protein
LALEAIVYEIAVNFRDEFGAEELATWQAPALLETLLKADPLADSSLEMKIQDPKSGEWVSLGRMNRIGFKALKKSYYALGTILHVPTILQIEGGNRAHRNRKRICQNAMNEIEKCLASTIFIPSLTIFGFIKFRCEGCGNELRRRLNALQGSPASKGKPKFFVAKCQHCLASYEVGPDPSNDQAFLIRAAKWIGRCPRKGCAGTHSKWMREVVDGSASICSECHETFVFKNAFGLFPKSQISRLGLD